MLHIKWWHRRRRSESSTSEPKDVLEILCEEIFFCTRCECYGFDTAYLGWAPPPLTFRYTHYVRLYLMSSAGGRPSIAGTWLPRSSCAQQYHDCCSHPTHSSGHVLLCEWHKWGVDVQSAFARGSWSHRSDYAEPRRLYGISFRREHLSMARVHHAPV